MENRQPLVSIITPVYNASKFLNRCMDSLLGQTYKDIEVIAVDDCSTDDSGRILDDYAKHDSRVVVVTNADNMGAPASRNEAMKSVHGDYVMEVDADDWIDADAIEVAMACLLADKDTDIAVLQLEVHDEAGGIVERSNKKVCLPEVMSGNDACYLSMDWSISGVFVAKRKVFDDVPYDTTCGVYGDENTTHLQYLHANKVRQTQGRYHFTMNNTSVTHAVNIKRFDIIEGRRALRQQLIDGQANERLLSKQVLMMWRDYIGVLCLYIGHKQEFSDYEQRNICQRLKHVYNVFSMSMLPLSEVLKPGYMLLPSYSLFYAQMRMVCGIKKLLKR